MRTFAALTLLLLACVPAVPLASSESYVTVTFRYGYATDSEDNPSCAIVVPAGVDGRAVLRAAFDAFCVSQYATASSGGGTRVRCLQGVCETHVTSWTQRHDGSLATGLEGFVAAEGSVLSLTYAELPLPA